MTAVGDVLYVAEADLEAAHVLALDAASGAPRWQQDVDGLIALVADGDGAYYVGASGLVRAWDASGRERWTWSLNGLDVGPSGSVGARGAVAVAKDSVVVAFDVSSSEDSTHTAVPGLARLTEGELEWRQDFDAVESAVWQVDLVATDDAVILGKGGSVYAVAWA